MNIKYSVLFEHRIILDFHFNFSIRDICSALTKSNISQLCRSTMNLEGRCRQLTKQKPRLYCTQHDEETHPTAGGKNEAIVTSGNREETDIRYGAMGSKQLREPDYRTAVNASGRRWTQCKQTILKCFTFWTCGRQAETARDIKRPLIQIPQHYIICGVFVS
jgi:hypothetical protein